MPTHKLCFVTRTRHPLAKHPQPAGTNRARRLKHCPRAKGHTRNAEKKGLRRRSKLSGTVLLPEVQTARRLRLYFRSSAWICCTISKRRGLNRLSIADRFGAPAQRERGYLRASERTFRVFESAKPNFYSSRISFYTGFEATSDGVNRLGTRTATSRTGDWFLVLKQMRCLSALRTRCAFVLCVEPSTRESSRWLGQAA